MNNAPLAQPIINSLKRRNFIIFILRILVPFTGLLLLAFLVLQIIIANLSANFDLSGIRVKRDRLIIDNPQYSGIMANGTKYFVVAQRAETEIAGSDEIELFDSEIDLIRKDNYQIFAKSKNALFNMAKQTIIVKELLEANDNRGKVAFLYDTKIDWVEQTIKSKKDVKVEFNDGSVLLADSLLYDAKEQIWNFTNASLLIEVEEE